ncbi:hypothetical protein ACS0TY_011142 [Phlomoides rotata]
MSLGANDKRGRIAHPNWLLRGFMETILDVACRILISRVTHTLGVGSGVQIVSLRIVWIELQAIRVWGRHIATAWKKNKKDLENEISMLESKDDVVFYDRYIEEKQELTKFLVMEEKHWK